MQYDVHTKREHTSCNAYTCTFRPWCKCRSSHGTAVPAASATLTSSRTRSRMGSSSYRCLMSMATRSRLDRSQRAASRPAKTMHVCSSALELWHDVLLLIALKN